MIRTNTAGGAETKRLKVETRELFFAKQNGVEHG
jgi:hypothetical protein